MFYGPENTTTIETQGMVQDQSQFYYSFWTNPSMQYALQPWDFPAQPWMGLLP